MKSNEDHLLLDDYDEFREPSIEIEDSSSYQDFNKVEDSNDDEDDYSTKVTVDTKKENTSVPILSPIALSILSTFSKWFRIFGIIIAIILCAYYIAMGYFKDLFYYLLLLVGSFFFGYFFVYLLEKYLSH